MGNFQGLYWGPYSHTLDCFLSWLACARLVQTAYGSCQSRIEQPSSPVTLTVPPFRPVTRYKSLYVIGAGKRTVPGSYEPYKKNPTEGGRRSAEAPLRLAENLLRLSRPGGLVKDSGV